MSDPHRNLFIPDFQGSSERHTRACSRNPARFTGANVAAAFLLSLLLISPGCGRSPNDARESAADPALVPAQLPPDLVAAPLKPQAAASEIVLTSASNSQTQPSTIEPAGVSATLQEGSPEWLIHEIARIRTAPIDVIRQPAADGAKNPEPLQLDAEQAAKERKRRNEETVQLAMQAIAKTHQDSSREQLFNSAVHYLADARMQLALAGDEHQLKLMVENADALFERDPTSFAAVEAAGRLLQLTQIQAQHAEDRDGRWSQAFARQSQLFANRFPQETSRAAVNLIAAARMCEQFRQPADALACYTVIDQRYPGTPFSEQVAGPLRRLRLPGTPLQEFGGSTHDGGFLSMEQLHGKPLLIVFWASNSAKFQADLPTMQSALARHVGRVNAVGVNFDRDESAIDAFLERTGLDWKQIFYSDPEKRGVYNPIARYYGVMSLPQYWLVDREGIVRSVDLQVAELDQILESVSR